MRCIPALAALALLGGCAVAEVDGPAAVTGKDLETATGLYGPWNEVVNVRGRPVYLWRRSAVVGEKTYFCELHVELGFLDAVARSYLRGYPQACAMFNVRYETKLQ